MQVSQGERRERREGRGGEERGEERRGQERSDRIGEEKRDSFVPFTRRIAQEGHRALGRSEPTDVLDGRGGRMG